MATSPSLSYSITQRCKIHDGSVTQNGIISWSIEGQAEAAFNPSKANYLTDTSGWYSRYYWAANSGTYTFDTDAYTFSVLGSTIVYTKTIVKSSTGSLVSSYNTESEASSACAGVANSAFYIYEYKLESGKYNVYRYDLSVQTTSQEVLLTKSISLSGYVDRTYTTPYVTGVSFGSTTQVRMPHYSGTGTGSASMLSYTISVYNPGGVSYTPSRTVNNSNSSVIGISHSESSRSGTIEISTKSIGTSTITVSSGGYSDSVDVTTYGVWTYGSDSDSVYCSFSNVQSGDTLSVTAGSKTNTVTASGTSQNVWVTGLSSSTSYSVSASVNGTTVWSGTITTDAATPSPSVSSVTISGDDTHSLTVGESKTINYSISISNDNGSYTPSVSVASSNSTAVSYSDLTKSRTSGSFKINALAAGSATITVTAGSKTDTITVNSTAATPEVTVPSVDGWFITNNSIGVRIKDLNAGEVVTLNVGSQTKTAASTNGGSLDLVVDGLSAGTAYDVVVSTDLNGTLWSGQKSTEATMPDMPDTIVLFPEITGWWITSSTMRVAVRNLAAGEEIMLTVGSTVIKLTAEANGVGLDLTAIGLTPNTTYTVSVVSNINGTLFSGSKKTSSAGSKTKGAYIGVDNVARKVKKQYVGIDNTARRIKKAYIGIGGVARPCFGGGELGYYGTITAFGTARESHAATSNGKYALFAGGSPSSATSVEVYDASLVHSTAPTGLSVGRYWLAATSVGEYAIFGGGYYNKTNVDAYNSSLTYTSCTAFTKGVCELAATTVGNYALFGGGKYVATEDTSYSYVYSYNGSLTKGSPTALSKARNELAATTVGDYAIFAGGYVGYGSSAGKYSTVDTYSASLTKSTASSLSTATRDVEATTVGDYALFAGGASGSTTATSKVVNAYNRSLTRSTPTALSVARYQLAATTVGNYAIFGGGSKTFQSSLGNSKDVDVYDESLVRTVGTSLSKARGSLAATSIGDYALFGGGNTLATVEAYVCERPEITVNISVIKTVGNTLYFTTGEKQTVTLKAKVGMKYSDLPFADTNTFEIPGSSGNALTILLHNGYPAYKITTSAGKSLTILASDGGVYVSTALTDGMTVDFGSNYAMDDYDYSDWTFA